MTEVDVVLSPDAEADLEQIGDYVFQQSGSRRIMFDYVNRLRRACDQIGLVPEGARIRSDLGRKLRCRNYRRNARSSTVSTPPGC